RQQAVLVHQLQGWGGYCGTGRPDQERVSFRPRSANAEVGMIPAAAPWVRVEELGASVPELTAFQDEPPQMKSGTVGKTGFLRLGFERRRTQTILANLER